MTINQEFNNNAYDNSCISLDNSAKRNWDNSFLYYTPKELYKEITRDIPEHILEGTTLSVKFEDNKQWDSILLQNKDKDKTLFSFQYFNESGNRVDFISADVDEKLQGNNISKIVQRNIFEILKDTGTNTIEIAATSVGNYAWARMGFIPEQDEWNELRENISKRFEDLINACIERKTSFNTDIATTIDDALSNNDPKAIWNIADLKSPFSACEKINWGQALLLPEEYIPEELKEHINDSGIMSFSFNGHIDLCNRDNMERVCSYLYKDDEYPVLMEGLENKSKSPALICQ